MWDDPLFVLGLLWGLGGVALGIAIGWSCAVLFFRKDFSNEKGRRRNF